MRWLLAMLFLAGVFFSTDALAVSRAEAWQGCFAKEAEWEVAGGKGPAYGSCSEMAGSTETIGTVQYKRASDGGALGSYNYNSGCPAGQTWQTSTHTCFDSQACLAKAPLGNAFTTSGAGATCVQGCLFRPDVSVCGTWPGKGTVCSVSGAKPTGGPCNGEPPPQTQPPEQGCTPASNGQTFCIKPDGHQCYTASSGRQICWQPGETGTKTDGPTAQKRDAGSQPIAPNTQLPNGDTLVSDGQPQSTTSTVTNNTTNTTQNITTVTQNYHTQNGTNASGGSANTDSGEPGDGTGSGSGTGDGDGTGATGGTNCETPPIVTGDAALGMVATQTWATRCAAEAGNAAKVTGSIEDCSQPFSVEGTNANAVKLRAMRAQLCKGDANGDGKPDWTDGDAPEGAGDPGPDTEPLPKRFGLNVSTDLLDTSDMFGGAASCPNFEITILGATASTSDIPNWCTILQIARGLILIFAAFTAVRMLLGE